MASKAPKNSKGWTKSIQFGHGALTSALHRAETSLQDRENAHTTRVAVTLSRDAFPREFT